MKRFKGVFFWSLVLALLIHGLLLGWIPVPQFTRSPLPLEVTLVPMPEEEKPQTPVTRRPQPKTKGETATRLPVPVEVPVEVPAPKPVETGIPDTALPPVPTLPESPAPKAPEPAPPPVVAPLPPEPPPPVPIAPPKRPKTIAEKRLATLPPRGEIDYDVSLGSVDLPVAKGTLQWKIEDGRYRLSLEAKAVGIARLLKSNPVLQTSEGRTTPQGLEPQEYRVLGRLSENDEAIAKFDWTQGVLSLSPSGASFPITPGAQDLLSFFFQFSVSPPETEGMTREITNGRKLDKYSYELTERTTLKLPMGKVDVLHVSRLTGLNEDSFEIWLGENYHLLPLQIRFFARGRRITMYARDIRMAPPINSGQEE